jgi:hypothetical protein
MHMASLAMMQEASGSLGKENRPWNNKGDSHNNSSHINSSSYNTCNSQTSLEATAATTTTTSRDQQAPGARNAPSTVTRPDTTK